MIKIPINFKKAIVFFRFFPWIFWLALFLLLCLKFVLITNFGDEDFLRTYKFFSPDSYDWIANGIRLFQNDSITFRSPGLPLIIKILSSCRILFLLPLINQIVFLFLVYFTFKITNIFIKKQYFSYIIVVYIFYNYSFQNFANYILADYYAILCITISLYFLLKGSFKAAFFLLGVSLLFQNLAFLLFPLWFVFYLIQEKLFPQDFNAIRDFQWYKKGLVTIMKKGVFFTLIFFNINLLWFIYKFIKFGSPFYTKTDQLACISINFNSIFFYIVNSYTIFGLLLIFLVGTFIWNFRKYYTEKLYILFISLFATVIFWVIVYEWNDRRFLLYLLPYIYPLAGVVLEKFIFKLTLKYFIFMILLLYPTNLSIGDFFNFYTIPISPIQSIYFAVQLDQRQQGFISFPANYSRQEKDLSHVVSIVNPTYAELIEKVGYNRRNDNIRFTEYSTAIKNNYNEKENTLCIDIAKYSNFELNSIMLIVENKSLEETDIYCCCN